MRPTIVLLIDIGSDLADAAGAVVASTSECRLETAETVDSALTRLRWEGVALVLASLDSTGEDEIARLLAQLAAWPRPVPVVVLTSRDDPEQRLRMLRLGAVDCVDAHLDCARLAFLIDILTVRARCEGVGVGPADPSGPAEAAPEGDFLYPSPKMREIMRQVAELAPRNTTILLAGETGTGKSHLAKLVHKLSPRAAQPFAVVRCGALPVTLLESALFGHVRGAFTSADRDQPGKFAEAGEGTLLLDEVDCVPLEAQAKLLHAVEDRVFEPVGSTRSQPFRARLIAATNRPLADLVAGGQFRADLYYRLNVVSFHLPPLRERRELIRPLVAKFLADFAAQEDRPARSVSPAALALLEDFDWPGNVRELRNVMERAVALCPRPVIQAQDLPEPIRYFSPSIIPSVPPPPAKGPATRSGTNRLEGARKQAELRRLTAALARRANNRTEAAAELGISRVTLYKKLRRYGLI